MRRLLSVLVLVALTMVLVAQVPALTVDQINTKKLRDAVTVGGILEHERVFQRIANQNGGTRASGTPGYAASAAYVRTASGRPGTTSPSSRSRERSPTRAAAT